MLRQKIWAACCVLMLSACASKVPDIKGVDGSEILPSFANFPDIPFPKEAYLDMENTKALGSGENWIGSVSFKAPYGAGRVFDFYISEMPKLRWTEIAIVRTKISHMTYARDARVVQILIEAKGDKDSHVTITAIPHQTSATTDL
ncbi:MAG: hypothetical protein IKR60_00285 [Alphaproteobacteria bacterium]|nr:hypothetical protein [Alphaproteobacteria bacterium]